MSATSLTLDRSSTWGGRLRDYVELTKPKIAVLVLIVVAVSGFVARFGQPDPLALLHAMLGTALVAASASALNHWMERERDARMDRTCNRPLPAGRLAAAEVLAFAGVTILAGMLWLAVAVNARAAICGLLTWVVYVWLYTPLKARTSWNTAVGAVSGALPVLIGWSAVGGAWDLRAAALFLLVFLWQFPHFMAIAWIYRRQYERAGMKMLSVVDPVGRRVGAQAVLGAAALLPVSAVFGTYHPGLPGLLHLCLALLLGLVLLGASAQFFRRRDDVSARRLLRASLIYLPALLALLMFVPLV